MGSGGAPVLLFGLGDGPSAYILDNRFGFLAQGLLSNMSVQLDPSTLDGTYLDKKHVDAMPGWEKHRCGETLVALGSEKGWYLQLWKQYPAINQYIIASHKNTDTHLAIALAFYRHQLGAALPEAARDRSGRRYKTLQSIQRILRQIARAYLHRLYGMPWIPPDEYVLVRCNGNPWTAYQSPAKKQAWACTPSAGCFAWPA